MASQILSIACIEQRCNCHSHNGFLTRRGYELAAGADSSYLDKVGSVSALVEVEEDVTYDPRHTELNEPFEIVDPQRCFEL